MAEVFDKIIILNKDGTEKEYDVSGSGIEVDTEMSDVSTNAVQNKTIKQYVDTEVDSVKLAKFPNVTIIGEPTINGGQMTDFSVDNYARFPFLVDLTNKSFEINFEILTGTNVINQQNIFDSDFGFAFAVRNSRFVIAMSSTGTDWNIGESIGINEVLPNTQYKIRISWDKSIYKVEISLDGGQSYIDDIVKPSNLSLYPVQIYIGVGENYSQVFNTFGGMIDFTDANLIVDGVVRWVGLDVVGIDTRMARDVSNIDDAGKQRIIEIVGEHISVDTEMSDTSENAVQNKVIKKYVDDHSGTKIDIDEEMSDESTNPVQNKVIKQYVDEHQGTVDTELSNTSTNPVQNKAIKNYIDDNVLTIDDYHQIEGSLPSGEQLETFNTYMQAQYISMEDLTEIEIDEEMSDTSPNLVSNSVIKRYVDEHGGGGGGGISPTAKVVKIDNVSTFTVTDKDGTTEVQILDGAKGDQGDPGIAKISYEYNEESESLILESGTNKIELTEEHKTGELFNGKPVYEKIIFGTMPNTKVKAKIADTSTIGVKDMINYDAFIIYSDGGTQRIQDICDDNASSQWVSRLVYTNNEGIYAVTSYPYWGGLQTRTYIKYTKTTD